MRKTLIGLLVGLVIGAGPVLAVGHHGNPRDAVCRELYTLGLEQYDRAFLALQDLIGHSQPRVWTAALRLQRVDDTWIAFDQLGRKCARVR